MQDQVLSTQIARLTALHNHLQAALILARMRLLGERLQGILKDAPNGFVFDVRATVLNEVIDGDHEMYVMPEVEWDVENEDYFVSKEQARVAEAICERLDDEIAENMVPLHRISGARFFSDLKARIKPLDDGQDPFLLAEMLWPKEAGFYREELAARPHYTQAIEDAFFSDSVPLDEGAPGFRV